MFDNLPPICHCNMILRNKPERRDHPESMSEIYNEWWGLAGDYENKKPVRKVCVRPWSKNRRAADGGITLMEVAK
jgi:hypothetical protein